MFTGLIGEIGSVSTARRVGGGLHITVAALQASSELAVDDSVCINGACLTVIAAQSGSFTVEAVEETLRKTTIGELNNGDRVNLELALRPTDRLGGHLVQGHVDCVGSLTGIERKASSWLVTVAHPEEFSRYVVPVGSIAIDGISLTIAMAGKNTLTISVIPHTLASTTLGSAREGQRVNLEFDLIGKYVERQLAGRMKEVEGISKEKLKEWGWG